MMKNLLIFDLDGTLLNSIADLANSTNYALTELYFATHRKEDYNFMVGNGINKLFERALPDMEKTEQNIHKMRELFIKHYSVHNTDESTPYEGVENLLATLQDKGIKLAVASNKYQAGTEKLVKHFFPRIHFELVLGQRENIPVKPNPCIVEEILEHCKVEKSATLYIGDSAVDMQTAANAKVEACGVSWGFRPLEELEQEHPAHIVNHPKEILELL